MSEDTTQKETTTKASTQHTAQQKSGGASRSTQNNRSRGQGQDQNQKRNASQKKRRGGSKRRDDRTRSEYDQKIVGIRRVTRVVAGGRRFSFSVTVVVGNYKGSVGVGIGKAGDTAQAIDKAVRNAKKNMLTLSLTENNSISHETTARYCASHVMMRPAPGRGLVAGSSVRNVLQMAGITDVNAKLLSRSSNQLNNARAAMEALAPFAREHAQKSAEPAPEAEAANEEAPEPAPEEAPAA